MTLTDRLIKLFWWLPIGQVPEISAADLHKSLTAENTPQILDVRTATEWRHSHIPGAVNVSLKQLKKNLQSLELDTGRPIVAICLSAHRSIPAVRLLHAHGFTTAVQLQGGMLAWWKQNYPSIESD